ncbi:MAG: alpha/beta hydrolase [Cytophagaceae bacterium]|nr:alpha/beta hydrolase [Gemmatimonadaceae bacterium]
MNVMQRNNVHVHGRGPTTLVFVHGFGCDQNMWRLTEPAFRDKYRTVLLDLVGNGKSDLALYDATKYASLDGYASDLLEVVKEVADGPVVFVGHSVSATICMLAANREPDVVRAQIMVCPSPNYINDEGYIGGFTRPDIEGLLETLDANYLGWSAAMGPVIMGAPDRPELGVELTNSFCRTDPAIAAGFARATFLSDHRADARRCVTPTLILQCTDDVIAPRSVGDFMHEALVASDLALIENVGHCPQLSAPAPTVAAIDAYLTTLLRPE